MVMKNSVPTSEHTVCDEIAALQTLDGFGLSVHPECCVRLRNRHASCRRCADACTSGAIALVDNEWHLDPQLCVGCGTCATVCPTGALEAQHPGDAELLRACLASAKMNDGMVVLCCNSAALACSGGRAPQGVVPVICLSRIDETLLFSLKAAGVAQLRAVRGSCAGCPREQGAMSIDLVAKTAAEVARTWGIELNYALVDEFPAGLGDCFAARPWHWRSCRFRTLHGEHA